MQRLRRCRTHIQLRGATRAARRTAACRTGRPGAGRDYCTVLRHPGSQSALTTHTAAAATAEQEVAHSAIRDKLRKLAGRQNRIATREATQRHHWLVCRKDQRVGFV